MSFAVYGEQRTADGAERAQRFWPSTDRRFAVYGERRTADGAEGAQRFWLQPPASSLQPPAR